MGKLSGLRFLLVFVVPSLAGLGAIILLMISINNLFPSPPATEVTRASYQACVAKEIARCVQMSVE
jgi:hypothetical protein